MTCRSSATNYKLVDADVYTLVRFVTVYPNPNVGRVETVVWMREGVSHRGEKVWINMSGGFRYTEGSEVLATRRLSYAETTKDLDWTQTSRYKELAVQLNDDTLDCGWITPKGRILYCQYGEHDAVAFLILGKSVREVEKTHVRISLGEPVVVDSSFWDMLTAQQAKAIKLLNSRRKD